MKGLLIALVLIFHQFTNGYWIMGYSIPGVYSVAIDSEGSCVKYIGEEVECTKDDKFFMQYLYHLDLYKNTLINF